MKIILNLFALICLVVLNTNAQDRKVDKINESKQGEHISYSFAVFGCNRVDKKDTSYLNPSTANVAHLKRTFEDLANTKPLPNFLFVTGDLILGYSPDTTIIEKELMAWKDIYESSALSKMGIRLVVIPGNHEVMLGKNKPAYEAAERTWIRVMNKYILGNNGPKMFEEDSLLTDQSCLSYSFKFKQAHFVVLNSDPVGKEWQVPYKWIRKDLLHHASKSKQIFVFAHKAAYPFPNEDGLSNVPAARDSFWKVLEQAKCDAFFSAHNHVYYRTQPHAKSTWQVIAGNGGSLLSEEIKDDSLKYFGYTLVQVFSDNKIKATSFGRNFPLNNYQSAPIEMKTTIRDSFQLNESE